MGQRTHETMLRLIGHQENASKTTVGFSSSQLERPSGRNHVITNVGKAVGEVHQSTVGGNVN